MKLLRNELYLLQKKVAKQALRNQGFALWMEQGTGKTITALKVAAVRWRRQQLRYVLVVGPKNAIGTWARQIPQHLNIPHRGFCGKKGLDQFLMSPLDPDKLSFLVINYELAWRRVKVLMKARPLEMVILDEAHRIKNRNSRQAKGMHKLGDQAKWKLTLTGTPQVYLIFPLWSQMRFIVPQLFGVQWTAFKNQYLRKAGYGGYKLKFKTPRLRNRFLDKLAPYVARVRQDEMLDLPPEVDTYLYFPLSGEARRVYRELEKDFVTQFQDIPTTTPLAITNMIRLQQVTGGFLPRDDGTLVRLEQDKLAIFADWLEDFPAHEKLVVFARFTAEIDMICQVLKRRRRSYVVLDGRTKDRTCWMAFQDHAEPKTIVCQVATANDSIDLYAASTMFIYSKTFSYIQYDQMRKRIRRNGQERTQKFIHAVAENTIDERLIFSLNETDDAAQAVFDHLRNSQPARRPMMAKKTKTDDTSKNEAPAEKKSNLPPLVKPQYGIDYITEQTQLEPTAIRQRLRSIKDEVADYKQGRLWDFQNKKNADAVVKKVLAASGKKSAAAAEPVTEKKTSKKKG